MPDQFYDQKWKCMIKIAINSMHYLHHVYIYVSIFRYSGFFTEWDSSIPKCFVYWMKLQWIIYGNVLFSLRTPTACIVWRFFWKHRIIKSYLYNTKQTTPLLRSQIWRIVNQSLNYSMDILRYWVWFWVSLVHTVIFNYYILYCTWDPMKQSRPYCIIEIPIKYFNF